MFTGQDTRYEEANEGSLDSLNLTVNRDPELRYLGTPHSGPFADEICKRSCFCAYNRRLDIPSSILAPYQACSPPLPEQPYDDLTDSYKYHSQKACWEEFQDGDWLGIANYLTVEERYKTLLNLTTANMTLLKFYGLLDCNVTVGPGAKGTFPVHDFTNELDFDFKGLNWTWVPDDAEYVYQNPYECFSDFDNIGYVMDNYSYGGDNTTSLDILQCTDVILWEQFCLSPINLTGVCDENINTSWIYYSG